MKFILSISVAMFLGVGSVLLFSDLKTDTVKITGEDFKAILIANNYLASRANLTESEIKTPMPQVMFLENYYVKVSHKNGKVYVHYFDKREDISGGDITLTIDMKKNTVSSIVDHK
ncbi:hypothetical protein MHM98_03550 [Psychrobium sp. MM17-31]|uniref:hypothetical protein n=1 Tax=Psychrobium sp. MM17-31 TaxID=2917758 RepID=UPI001EF70840|nr:hypothetical protein [Psychrobium sp. MM17-31]MCG7530434.1 hypothetical protein [Psychrobium sp. MM17-31]